jgi:hypothetical protein
MATVQSVNRLAPRRALRNAAAGRSAGTLGSSPTLLQTLAFAGQTLLGAVLLFFGILMISTLFLLPVGLPLALLGVALIVAPSSS